MTPDELTDLIRRGDATRLTDLASAMTETERRKLSKTAAALWKAARRGNLWEMIDPISVETASDGGIWSRMVSVGARLLGYVGESLPTGDRRSPFQTPHYATQLAVLAFCPLSEAKKVDGGLDLPDKLSLRILVDRKPAWLNEWVESKYSGNFGRMNWFLLRELMQSGLCEKPKADSYVQQMAEDLARPWGRQEKRPISEWLQAEPDLLDDVHRFFDIEVDVLGEDYRNWAVRQDEAYESWIEAITKLSAQGHLDRQRMLDGCLGGLHHDFKKNSLTGYIRLFESLEATDAELDLRQQALLDLLSVEATHVVAFALKMLKRLSKAEKLNAEAYLSAVSAVFSVRTKSQPKTALALISHLCGRQPELIPWAVSPVLDALAHEMTDVQEKAIAVLEAWAPRLHTDHGTALQAQLEELAATLRPRAEAILREMGVDIEPVSTGDGGGTADVEDLMTRAAELDCHWSRIAMVPDSLDAVKNGCMAGPLELDILEIPLLSALEPIRPIETVEELIDAVSHAVEELESADELERILDGISRLGSDRPDGFIRRSDPLLKRIEGLRLGQNQRSILGGWGTIYAVRRLLRYWLRREVPLRMQNEKPLMGIHLLTERLKEIFDGLVDHESRELLATPTHRHGWIEPTVLVERLVRWQQSATSLRAHDFVQALLRLAPDNRAGALGAAAEVGGNVGRIFRWALGSDDGPTRQDRDERFLWLAAGRARDPVGRLADLEVLKLGTAPDGVVPAQYEWRCFRMKHERRASWAQELETDELEVFTYPELQEDSSESLEATVQLHSTENRYFFVFNTAAWQIEHTFSIWPPNLQPGYVRAIRCLKMRLDSPTSTFGPYHAYFGPLFEADRPWPELAYLAVCLGLLSKDTESHTAALDALIEAITDGRVHPEPLGRVLTRVIAGGWVKMNRLADSLGETARLSPLHSWTAARVLTDIVANFGELPRDAHHVLTLLLELLTELGLELDEVARAPLEDLKGSSKTAKAAKALLALKSVANSPAMQQAFLQVLEARVNRAERWSAWMNDRY